MATEEIKTPAVEATSQGCGKEECDCGSCETESKSQCACGGSCGCSQ